jgi:hypothetical protein
MNLDVNGPRTAWLDLRPFRLGVSEIVQAFLKFMQNISIICEIGSQSSQPVRRHVQGIVVDYLSRGSFRTASRSRNLFTTLPAARMIETRWFFSGRLTPGIRSARVPWSRMSDRGTA